MLILKDYELPRRVETFGKGISDSELKERLNKIVETDVSLEQCARYVISCLFELLKTFASDFALLVLAVTCSTTEEAACVPTIPILA